MIPAPQRRQGRSGLPGRTGSTMIPAPQVRQSRGVTPLSPLRGFRWGPANPAQGLTPLAIDSGPSGAAHCIGGTLLRAGFPPTQRQLAGARSTQRVPGGTQSQPPAASRPGLRHRDQRHVIGHKTTAANLDPFVPAPLVHQLQVRNIDPVVEERPLPAIAALRHMVRQTGNNQPCQSRRARRLPGFSPFVNSSVLCPPSCPRPSPLATRLPWKPCCRIAGLPYILSIGWNSGKKIPRGAGPSPPKAGRSPRRRRCPPPSGIDSLMVTTCPRVEGR